MSPNKHMIKNKGLITLVLLIGICFAGISQAQQNSYSFFVAGHTNGQPGVKNGIHPPFKEKFEYIRSRPEIKFGIFTGDIVAANPKAEDWDKVDADLDTLGLPVHFTVGNHDMENRELYESRYGNTYYSFSHQNDLFIVLDPNLNQWNITGAQLEFLKNTLNSNTSTTNNIFVLFHQLLWWKPNNVYANIGPNSFEGRADSINFWSEVEPLFTKLPNEVFMFSGDVGAGSWAVDFMYDKYDNISLIASGMGEGPGDNFIVVNILENNSVTYDLICLTDTVLNCFGNITDYRLTTSATSYQNESIDIQVYPNPVNNRLRVSIHSAKESLLNFHLYDLNGRKIMSRKIPVNAVVEIEPTLNNGIYFYRVAQDDIKIKSGSLIIQN